MINLGNQARFLLLQRDSLVVLKTICTDAMLFGVEFEAGLTYVDPSAAYVYGNHLAHWNARFLFYFKSKIFTNDIRLGDFL